MHLVCLPIHTPLIQISDQYYLIGTSISATFSNQQYQVQQLFTDTTFSDAPLKSLAFQSTAAAQVRSGYLPPTQNANIPDNTYLPAQIPGNTYLPAEVPDRTYLPAELPDRTYLPVVPDKTYLPVAAPPPNQTYLPAAPNNVYLPANAPSNAPIVDATQAGIGQTTDGSSQPEEGLQPPLPGSPIPETIPIISPACLISCVG